jgi:hypothetical protein
MFALLLMLGFVARGVLVTDIRSCVSRTISCANCSRYYFAWNDFCAAALSARRAAASQLGFSAEKPLTMQRCRPIPSGHLGPLDGRSFAGVLVAVCTADASLEVADFRGICEF